MVVDLLQNARTNGKSNDRKNDPKDTYSKKKAFPLYIFLNSFEIRTLANNFILNFIDLFTFLAHSSSLFVDVDLQSFVDFVLKVRLHAGGMRIGEFLFATAKTLKLFVGAGSLMANLAFEWVYFPCIIAHSDNLGFLDGNKGLISVKLHLK
jgi:hypothetical protein